MDPPGDFVVMQGNLRADVTRNCLALAKAKGAITALNPSPTYAAQDYDWTLVDLVVAQPRRGDRAGGRRGGGGGADASPEGRGRGRSDARRGRRRVLLGRRCVSRGGAEGDRDRHGRGRRRVLRRADRRQEFLAAAGEKRSPPRPRPLRFRSRERESSLPFRPGRRWRPFLARCARTPRGASAMTRRRLPSRETGRTR